MNSCIWMQDSSTTGTVVGASHCLMVALAGLSSLQKPFLQKCCYKFSYKTNEFKNKYKQALFEILREYFIKFRLNNYKLYQEPLKCRNKAVDYLACSDNIYDWFSKIYVKVDNIVELYKNMSKNDKKSIH